MTHPRHVKKRDGRQVPFDPRKIADAIFRAARSVGGEDRLLAEELASVVTLFLERDFATRIPAIEEIQDLVEKVLIETGHARTAKAFILYREQRRALRERLTVRKTNGARAGHSGGSIDVASNVRQMAWSKVRIVEGLVNECGLPTPLAEEIGSTVENRVFESGVSRLSTSLIRELVNNELFERSLDVPLARQTTIGLPRYEIEPLLHESGAPGSLLERSCGRALLSRYAINALYPGPLVEAHLEGRLHIGGLSQPTRVMSATLSPERRPDETVESHASERTLDRLAARARQALGAVEEELVVFDLFDLWPPGDPEELDRQAYKIVMSLVDPERAAPPGRIVLSFRARDLDWSERALPALGALIRATTAVGDRWAVPLVRIELCDALLTDDVVLRDALHLAKKTGGLEIVATSRRDRSGDMTSMPISARVGLNLLRLARLDRGHALRELDEVVRLCGETVEARLRWLEGGNWLSKDLLRERGDLPEGTTLEADSTEWEGDETPRRAAFVPVLLEAALVARYGSSPLDAVDWLKDLLNHFRERIRFESRRHGFVGELWVTPWEEASMRLAKIESELDPTVRDAIASSQHPSGRTPAPLRRLLQSADPQRRITPTQGTIHDKLKVLRRHIGLEAGRALP